MDDLIKNKERFITGQLVQYRIGPDLKTEPAVTLFFDQSGSIPLLNSNLSISDIRILLCLSSFCEPETNILPFGSQEIISIKYELSKYGVEYTEETIKQAKKNLVKERVLASIKRGYLMINPAIMYYGGTRYMAQFRYGKKKSRKRKNIEAIRKERMKGFRQLIDNTNPVGKKLMASVLFDIYTANKESRHLASYRDRV